MGQFARGRRGRSLFHRKKPREGVCVTPHRWHSQALGDSENRKFHRLVCCRSRSAVEHVNVNRRDDANNGDQENGVECEIIVLIYTHFSNNHFKGDGEIAFRASTHSST